MPTQIKPSDAYDSFKRVPISLSEQESTPDFLVLTIRNGDPAKAYLVQKSFDRKTWAFVWVVMGNTELLVPDDGAKYRALELQ